MIWVLNKPTWSSVFCFQLYLIYLIIYEHCDDAADVVGLPWGAGAPPHLDHGKVGGAISLRVAGGAHNWRGNFSNLKFCIKRSYEKGGCGENHKIQLFWAPIEDWVSLLFCLSFRSFQGSLIWQSVWQVIKTAYVSWPTIKIDVASQDII